MLDTLDVLIGFTVVMLVVSMAVTMITQAFSTALVNLRGICLRAGIAKLLALMDRGLTVAEARLLSDHILRNPLVGTAPMLWGKHGLASVIHREELVKLILDFAVPGDAEKTNEDEISSDADEEVEQPNEAALSDEDKLRRKVRRSLELNGIPDPAEVLKSVRLAVVELEKSNPELSHNSRLNIALLNFASSDYLSKLNAWFDQSIDRVSDLFTRRIRAVTVIVAIVLAFLIQLDSVGLMNRLSVDDEMRNRLVSQALDNSEEWGRKVEAGGAALDRIAQSGGAQAGTPTPVTPTGVGNEVSDNAATGAGGETETNESAATGDAEAKDEAASGDNTTSQQLDEARRTLEQLGVVSLPESREQWQAAWWEKGEDGAFRWPFLIGILLSAALLSLGAPFWYSVLANLLKLRSVIARKDEVQRTERQTTQVVPAPMATAQGASSALPPNLAGGEAGDLRAAG